MFLGDVSSKEVSGLKREQDMNDRRASNRIYSVCVLYRDRVIAKLLCFSGRVRNFGNVWVTCLQRH